MNAPPAPPAPPGGRAAPAMDAAGLQRAAAGLPGVALDAAQAALLLRLLAELGQWNRAYNLTAIESPAAMITHHLLDSLSGSSGLHGARIADVGTGAGFPGLPLAIVNPARHFTLIDATAKKIRFVNHAVRTLGLGNVTALQARAESPPALAPFDTIVARAVAPLPQLAALAAPLARAGTRLLAWKGQRPEADAAESAPLPAPWRRESVRDVRVPGLDAGRCLVTLVADAAVPAGSPAG